MGSKTSKKKSSRRIQRDDSGERPQQTTTMSAADEPTLPSAAPKLKLQVSSELSEDYEDLHRQVKVSFTATPGAGLVGLNNLGNTCFMNSALQSLLNTTPLVDYFLAFEWRDELNPENPLSTGGDIATAFGALLESYWSGKSKALSPKKFKRRLARKWAPMQGYDQQDAQELLAFLLDGIHEDLNRVLGKKPYIEMPDVDKKPGGGAATVAELEAIAAECWAGYLKRNKSIVVDLFQGQLRSQLRCKHCGFTRHTFDPFMYLSLPVPNSAAPVSLAECLDLFSKPEEMSGGNQWYCANCKEHRDATKTLDLWKVPPVLIVHLKRFGARGRKLGTPLAMRELAHDFDLAPWLGSPQRDPPVFDLFSVINHMGGAGGGHYTAHGRSRVDKKWRYYDDSRVDRDDLPSRSKDPYVLFFGRSGQAADEDEFDEEGAFAGAGAGAGASRPKIHRRKSSPFVRRQTISNIKAWPHLAQTENKKLATHVSAPERL